MQSKLNKETKNKINVLIEDIKAERKRIYYCSIAEIYQKNFVANCKIAMSFDKAKQGLYDDAINDVVNVINQLGNLISSEVLRQLMFHMLYANEFYYYGVLNDLIINYFEKGNFGLVPPLDRPYVKIASKLNYKHNFEMNAAFQAVIDDNDFSQLIDFVANTITVPAKKCLHKTQNEIIEEIIIFYKNK